MADTVIRLVIAEDEDSIRERIEKYIRTSTTVIDEVYSAATGQEALDLIFRYRPQIMLMDIQMPVKDGLKVLREATVAGVCPKTIILSGHEVFAYAQKAMRYGVADYLLKPCRSIEILQKLEYLALEAVPERGSHAAKKAQNPEKPAEVKQHAAKPESGSNRFVDEALRYLYEHYPEDVTQPVVAEWLGVTAGYLSSLFTRHLGCGFTECLNNIRVERACDYFVDNSIKTYEVAFRVGFKDEKYFSSMFKKIMGVTPSQYRAGLRSNSPSGR
jgi:two-component system response regulator YesN